MKTTRSPRLPRRHRRAIADLYARDLSSERIASVLGVPVEQVDAAIGILDGAEGLDLPSIIVTRASVSVVYLTPDPDLDGPQIPVTPTVPVVQVAPEVPVKKRKGRPHSPCGTVAAAARHYRRKEPLDQECREAWNTYDQAAKARRKAKEAGAA